MHSIQPRNLRQETDADLKHHVHYWRAKVRKFFHSSKLLVKNLVIEDKIIIYLRLRVLTAGKKRAVAQQFSTVAKWNCATPQNQGILAARCKDAPFRQPQLHAPDVWNNPLTLQHSQM